MSTKHATKKNYFIVWVSLLALLFATWAAAQVNLGKFNNVIALTIAFAKMFLVLLFFMHVKDEKRLTWVFVSAGFIWLVIMVGYAMGDYITRTDLWSVYLNR